MQFRLEGFRVPGGKEQNSAFHLVLAADILHLRQIWACVQQMSTALGHSGFLGKNLKAVRLVPPTGRSEELPKTLKHPPLLHAVPPRPQQLAVLAPGHRRHTLPGALVFHVARPYRGAGELDPVLLVPICRNDPAR